MSKWYGGVWVLVLIVVLLAGCGGGTSSTVGQRVTGVAATGAALNGTVYLKDCSVPAKETFATTLAGGSFSLVVDGMTPPFILKAVGTANGTNSTLYSFASGAGIANINPLSNVVVAAANGGDPAALFTAPDPARMQAIKVALPDSVTKVRQAFQVNLAAVGAGNADFLSAPYQANHQGLDLMFDRNDITISNGSVTVTDRDTQLVTNLLLTNLQHIPAGSVDASFGTNGVASYALQAFSMGDAAVVLADGKILVLGFSGDGTTYQFFLARFTQNGSLDPAFGNAGIVYGPCNGANELLVQEDGKILVAGNFYTGTHINTYLARYNADGTVDSGFGTAGIFQTTSSNNEGDAKVAVQGNGKIILAGTEYINGITPFILRLNGDGSLDTSFGSGSEKTYLSGGAVGGLVVTPADAILVGLTKYSGEFIGIGFSILRYSKDGALDTGFGVCGRVDERLPVSSQSIFDLKVQPDGKIVTALGVDNLYHGGVINSYGVLGKAVAMESSQYGLSTWSLASRWYGVALMRFNYDGSPDTGFGSGGSSLFTSGASGIYANAFLMQPDGRFTFTGIDYNDSAGLAVMRLNGNGSIDTSFGSGGMVKTSLGLNTGEGRGVVVQGDGTIVVVGRLSAQSSNLVLVRYYM